MHDQVEKADN